MDLELKFIKEADFEIDEHFIELLEQLPLKKRIDILYQISTIVDDIDEVNGWTQVIAGVCTRGEPMYFLLELLKQTNEKPTLLDIYLLDVDEFLDHYLESNTINNYDKHKYREERKGENEHP